ncbi:MAG: hypothetical protein WC169_09925 [Dehalococcoidia bacterium]
MLGKIIFSIVLIIGFAGGFLTWLTLHLEEIANKSSDNTNWGLYYFDPIGCDINCVAVIQPYCWGAFFIGLIGVIYFLTSKK